jgi:hypothetical protein
VFQISPPSTFSGTGEFKVETVVAADRGQLNLFGFCNGDANCAPGQSMSVGGVLGTAFGDAGLIDTTVSLRGIDYTDFGFFESDLRFRLTGSVIVPQFNGNEATATAPFFLTGLFTDPLGQATTIVGRGTATARFVRTDGGDIGPGWHGDRIRYDFEHAAVVPEPSTIILLGSGIAGLAVSRRRRRAQPDTHA